MTTETTSTDTRPDYEVARDELRGLYASLHLRAKVGKRHFVSAAENPEKWDHFTYAVAFCFDTPGPSDTVIIQWRQGTGIDTDPDPAEVLGSACRDWTDAQTSFEDWAGEFGYSPDSRKAEKVWNACRKTLPDWFLTRETREQLAELTRRL